MQQAFAAMDALEGGRHRQPRREAHGRPLLAARRRRSRPTPELRAGDRRRRSRGIKRFAADVHDGAGARRSAGHVSRTCSSSASAARRSGPQFVRRGARHAGRPHAAVFFFDNTDPDGIDRVLDAPRRTTSTRRSPSSSRRSGGTKETRNGMLEAQAAVRARRARLRQARRRRHRRRQRARPASPWHKGWLARFPMWDWVGGRTSRAVARSASCPRRCRASTSTRMLAGARAMDEVTRAHDTAQEPGGAARAHVVLRRPTAGARRTWSSCPTRTASCSSRATCSSS